MDPQRQTAEKRVEEKIGFFVHAAVYAAVNALLIVLNLTGGYETLWFFWPLIGWGIGLAFHGLAVFVFVNGNVASFKERMIARELEKESRRKESPAG